MKKTDSLLLLTALFILITPSWASAKCKVANALGSWQLKYRYNNGQIGICTYDLNGDLSIRGSCQDVTNTTSVDFFDGGFTLKPTCQLTTWVIFPDGTLVSTSGKLIPGLGITTGRIVSRDGNGVLGGTFSTRRSAE